MPTTVFKSLRRPVLLVASDFLDQVAEEGMRRGVCLRTRSVSQIRWEGGRTEMAWGCRQGRWRRRGFERTHLQGTPHTRQHTEILRISRGGPGTPRGTVERDKSALIFNVKGPHHHGRHLSRTPSAILLYVGDAPTTLRTPCVITVTRVVPVPCTSSRWRGAGKEVTSVKPRTACGSGGRGGLWTQRRGSEETNQLPPRA